LAQVLTYALASDVSISLPGLCRIRLGEFASISERVVHT